MASGNLDDLLLKMRTEEARGCVRGPAERVFWEAVSRKTARICERRVGHADAPDLLQRSLMTVMKKLPGYTKQAPDGFSRWLHRIVHFEVLKVHRDNGNHQRKRTGEARAMIRAMACPEARLSSTLYKVEQLQAVERAMQRLTRLQREALSYVDTRALALALDITMETARARRRRAIRRLIVLLREITSWRVRIPTP